MDFLVDNYVWIIIIVIVILMAIVGYIADITDFGRKNFEKKVVEKKSKEKPKKEKVKEEKKVVETLPIVETPEMDSKADVLSDTNTSLNLDDKNVNLNELNDVESQFENENSVELMNNSNVENDSFNTMISSDVESNNFNTMINSDVNDSLDMENEGIDQSLFEPLPSIDQVFSDMVEVPASSNIGETVVEQESDNESDDDVWKF